MAGACLITPSSALLPLLLLVVALRPASGFSAAAVPRTAAAAAAASSATASSTIQMMARARGDGRRTKRVGQVIQSELATLIRSGDVRGEQRIPIGLQQLISVVDVDMSPDLRNARVKVSVIGDRKDKVSAVRWLRGNVRGLRHQLAQRNRQMRSIPMLTFDHVDVGAATDIMIKLEQLRRDSEEAEERRRREGEEAEVEDQDAWLDADDDDDFDWDDEDDE